MAEDNELKPNADDAVGIPAGDAPVEELSWEHVETYQPVSTDASDSETVFATRTDEVGATPAATPVAAPAAGPAQAADTAATNPYATVERQPVPTYMPAGATPPAGSAYAGPYTAAPGGPGTPAGNNPYAASGGYGTPMPQPQPQRPGGGKAVGALVCGILAILFSETVIVGIILGIVALVLAGQAVRAAGKDGKTTGAKVCGIIGIVLSVLSLVAYLILFAIGLAFLADYGYNYDYSSGSFSTTTPHGSNSSSDDGGSVFDGPLAITEDDQAALAAAVSALQNMDQDPELMAFIADEAANAFEYHTSGLTLEMVDIDPATLAQWLVGSVEIDTDDAISLSDEDTHTATVFLDVECYDMDEYISEIIDLVEEAPEVPDDDGEAALQLLHDCATEALASADTYEYSIAIDLTKEGDTWVADQSSLRETATLMFCLYTS